MQVLLCSGWQEIQVMQECCVNGVFCPTCIKFTTRSVLVKLHPITVYRTVFRECKVDWLNATVCFLWFTNCVLLYDKYSNTRMLVPLLFVLNNILILGIWHSAISHLQGCFCLRISDSTWCHRTPLCHIKLLNTDILQGSFKLCNWFPLQCLVSWINHLLPTCWSTFWKSAFKWEFGCGFDIMDIISSFFFHFHKCNCSSLDTSYHLLALALLLK